MGRGLDRIAILGAGGHGRVILSTAIACGVSEILLYDDHLPLGNEILGFKISGRFSDFKSKDIPVFFGIGDNALRKKLRAYYVRNKKAYLIHPFSFVSPDVGVGSGTVVMAGAVVQTGAILGEDVIVNTSSSVDHDCVLESFSHIAPACQLAGGCRVGEGAFLGIGTRVLPGKEVGCWSIVGAGSTVLQNLPEHIKSWGTPAKIQGMIRQEVQR